MNNIFSSVKQMLAFETFNSIKIGTERERERERERGREWVQKVKLRYAVFNSITNSFLFTELFNNTCVLRTVV